MDLIIDNYVVGEARVSLTATSKDHPFGERYNLYIVKVYRGTPFLDSASRNYPNARMLSEALRDAIGYGPARDLLRAHGVDEKSPLMYLGRNN